MEMTWKEFKDEIDKQLKEKGISENEQIWYIDISSHGEIVVWLDKNLGIAINE